MEILAQSSTAFVLTHNFQGTHILGASRGRLSDSVASCTICGPTLRVATNTYLLHCCPCPVFWWRHAMMMRYRIIDLILCFIVLLLLIIYLISDLETSLSLGFEQAVIRLLYRLCNGSLWRSPRFSSVAPCVKGTGYTGIPTAYKRGRPSRIVLVSIAKLNSQTGVDILRNL